MSRIFWSQDMGVNGIYYRLKSSIFVDGDDLLTSGRTSREKYIIDVLI